MMPLLFEELELVDLEQNFAGSDERQRTRAHREQMRTNREMEAFVYVRTNVSLDEAENVDFLAAVALRIVIERVQDELAWLVRPSFGTLAPPAEGQPRRWWEPEMLTRSWVPSNLLGAMYLQFYWLMTSAGDLSRCKQCKNIISHAPPIASDGQIRKPRTDKEFCDSRCRQNYHYHNRIKPARRGNKQGGDDPQS